MNRGWLCECGLSIAPRCDECPDCGAPRPLDSADRIEEILSASAGDGRACREELLRTYLTLPSDQDRYAFTAQLIYRLAPLSSAAH